MIIRFAIIITHNPSLHDRTKHIEVDKHFMKEKVGACVICISCLPTTEQTVDILTNGLSKRQIDKLLNKLAMEDIYKLACGRVLDFLYPL